MEKYRRFDDPSCGINPFVPLLEKPRPIPMKIIKIVSYKSILLNLTFKLSGLIFLLFKLPFLIVLLLMLLLFTLAKYIVKQ